MNRAYSMIEVKALDDEKRTFKGMATTPEVDRVGDVINPLGASFKNPLVLLHQHNHDAPIGQVRFGKPTAKGIEFEAEIPTIAEPGPLKDRVDTAWGEVKHGIVRAVSIGFRPTKYAFMENGGIDFQEIEIYELSTVSVPANSSAMIHTIKSLDAEARAAAGIVDTPSEPEPEAAPGQKSDEGEDRSRGHVVKLQAPVRAGTPLVINRIHHIR